MELTRIFFFGCGLILWATGLFASETVQPWEENPFSASPKAMVEAAHAVPEKDSPDVVVLLLEKIYRYDKSGRLEKHIRWVYQPRTDLGVENWSSLETFWSPWHQEKPELKVRICNPDGTVHHLTPDMVVESSSANSSDDIYSNDKTLRAPFPGVVKGSVIEELIITKEHTPFFEAGSVEMIPLVYSMPLVKCRAIIEVPKNVPFQYEVYKDPNLTPTRQKLKDGIRYTFERLNTKPYQEQPPGMAPEVPTYTGVGFSTGKSWKSIAASYSLIVDKALQGEDLSVQAMALKGENAKETALNILQWIHEKTRYTGLQLGEQAIIPASPSETLKRGFGDCKDQSTLMVGLLREAGYKADVALLRSNKPNDVSPNLPGIDQFNHAIVYIHGKEPLWFDPTSEFSRNGQLPDGNRGSLALVANPKTKSLQRIPYPSAEENKVVDHRLYTIPEEGFMDVVETYSYYGSLEISERYYHYNTSKEDKKINLQDYIKAAYRFGELENHSSIDAKDFSKPFSFQLKINDSGRGVSENGEVLTAIILNSIFSHLPNVFLMELEEPRKDAYFFRKPFSYEQQYEIRPPLGYIPREIPKSETLALGTATLVREFSLDENRHLQVRFHFTSGKQRLTAEEFTEMNRAVREYLEPGVQVIYFDHEGETLKADGDYKGSLALFRKLTLQEPEKTIHRIRMAAALLEAGMGEQARTVARQAIELDDQDARAWGAYAWILQHDAIGRRFQRGFDREEAIKAYLKAIELDPDNYVYRGDLAILYDRNNLGQAYGQGCQLQEAADMYRLIEEDVRAEFEINQIICHLFLEQYDEVAVLAEGLSDPIFKHAFSMLSQLPEKGLEATLQKATKIHPMEIRRSSLIQMGDLLVQLRRYSDASVVLRVAAKGSDKAMELEARADILARVKPFEELRKAPNKPKAVIGLFFAEMMLSKSWDFSHMKPYFTETAWQHRIVSKDENSFEKEFFSSNLIFRMTQVRPIVLTDISATGLNFELDGNEKVGWRVRVTYSGSGIKLDFLLFLTPGPQPKIVGLKTEAALLAGQVLQFLEAGNKEAADQWITWLKEIFGFSFALDPYMQGPFKHFDVQQEPRFVLAGLAALDTELKTDLTILKEGLQKFEGTPKATYIKFYIAETHLKLGQLSEAEPLLSELFEATPHSITLRDNYVAVLFQLDKKEKALKIVEQVLEKNPHDDWANSILIEQYSLDHDYEKLVQLFQSRTSQNRATYQIFNTMAWTGLFLPELPEKTLEYARTAVSLTNTTDYATLHTLATVFAEVGRCGEARQMLDKAMDISQSPEPLSDDWYVLGLIAEQFGVTEAALKAYRRVEKPEIARAIPQSAYFLAQRRIKNLTENPDTDSK